MDFETLTFLWATGGKRRIGSSRYECGSANDEVYMRFWLVNRSLLRQLTPVQRRYQVSGTRKSVSRYKEDGRLKTQDEGPGKTMDNVWGPVARNGR